MEERTVEVEEYGRSYGGSSIWWWTRRCKTWRRL